MTLLALNRRMGTRKRESRRVMIERGRRPAVDSVAGFAVRREAACDMVRECHAEKIALVAAVAVGGQAGEVGRPLLVTGEAVLNCVPADEREKAVVESRRSPADVDYVVAGLALSRETRLDVIRLGCGLVVLRVTGDAGDIDRREVQTRISGVAA